MEVLTHPFFGLLKSQIRAQLPVSCMKDLTKVEMKGLPGRDPKGGVIQRSSSGTERDKTMSPGH